MPASRWLPLLLGLLLPAAARAEETHWHEPLWLQPPGADAPFPVLLTLPPGWQPGDAAIVLLPDPDRPEAAAASPRRGAAGGRGGGGRARPAGGLGRAAGPAGRPGAHRGRAAGGVAGRAAAVAGGDRGRAAGRRSASARPGRWRWRAERPIPPRRAWSQRSRWAGRRASWPARRRRRPSNGRCAPRLLCALLAEATAAGWRRAQPADSRGAAATASAALLAPGSRRCVQARFQLQQRKPRAWPPALADRLTRPRSAPHNPAMHAGRILAASAEFRPITGPVLA